MDSLNFQFKKKNVFSIKRERKREREEVALSNLRHPEKFQFKPSKFLQLQMEMNRQWKRVTIASKFDLSAG